MYEMANNAKWSLALSYSAKINGYLYPQRVSPTLKKNAMTCSQRAMLAIQWGVTASTDRNGSLAHFFFISLWLFWVNNVWTQLGQECPQMIKKKEFLYPWNSDNYSVIIQLNIHKKVEHTIVNTYLQSLINTAYSQISRRHAMHKIIFFASLVAKLVLRKGNCLLFF
jgi:hypothetical protein